MHRTHLPKSCVFVAGCFGVKDPDIGIFFKKFQQPGKYPFMSACLCFFCFFVYFEHTVDKSIYG